MCGPFMFRCFSLWFSCKEIANFQKVWQGEVFDDIYPSDIKNSLWHSTLFFILLLQVKDNVELFPSSSRSFSIFFLFLKRKYRTYVTFVSCLPPYYLQVAFRLLVCSVCVWWNLSLICALSLVLSFIRLIHDSHPKYECGFESGKFIGYEEKQRKKELNLTAIFKSTISSFFFFPFVVRCLDLDTQTSALQMSVYLCALFYDKSLYCRNVKNLMIAI